MIVRKARDRRTRIKVGRTEQLHSSMKFELLMMTLMATERLKTHNKYNNSLNNFIINAYAIFNDCSAWNSAN